MSGCRNRTWASGTGYGSGCGKSREVWDARQAASAQDAQDAELRRVMSGIAAALGCDIPGPPLSASDTGLDAMSSGWGACTPPHLVISSLACTTSVFPLSACH